MARYAVGYHVSAAAVGPVPPGSRGDSGLEGDVAWNVTLPGQRHIVSNRRRCPRGNGDPVKSSEDRLRVTF